MACNSQNDTNKCQDKDNEEISEDHEGSGRDDSQSNVLTIIQQISWVFEPLHPFYSSVKSSCSFTNNFFSLIEDWVCQLVVFLTNVDLRCLVKDEINEIPMRIHSIVQDSSMYLDPIIKPVYKLWFQAHQNILASVDYIANVYEEIVPLLPGDKPWTEEDKNLSIRELCFYATTSMAYRLVWHSKKFLQQTFTFFEESVQGNSTT